MCVCVYIQCPKVYIFCDMLEIRLYMIFLSILDAGIWLCQLLDVFLLSMRCIILGKQLVEPVYDQFLVYSLRADRFLNGVRSFFFT